MSYNSFRSQDIGRLDDISLFKSEQYSAVVVSIGDIDITAREFLFNYEFGPAFLKRQKDSKNRYLNLMIYEKLLALDGYARGLKSSPQVRKTLKAIEGDLITEELYKDDVMSEVSVTEQEIEEGIQKNRENITIKWLFSKTEQEITHQKKMLSEGASFDSLFMLQVNNAVTIEDRSLEITRFRLQIKNPDLSAVVDSMTHGNISDPIKVENDGWYIIKITDGWINPIMTETEWMKQRYNVDRALFKLKMDRLSDQYVDTMMFNEDPVIIRKTFNILQAYIGKNVLRPEKYSEWDLNKYLYVETDPSDILKIDDYNDMTLVNYKSGQILLNDFIEWYKARKSYLKFDTGSPQGFFGSIQRIIWQMMRDKLLIDRAYQRGLQKRDVVKIQQKWWEEKVLYAAVKAEVAQSIKIDEQQLINYYEQNKQDYKYSNGNIIPYEKTKNDVRNDYLKQEYMTKLFRRILKLKQKYEISINQDVLANLAVESENDPKAIDVYTVKTGGILPRQAFPTVDWDWQAWY